VPHKLCHERDNDNLCRATEWLTATTTTVTMMARQSKT